MTAALVMLLCAGCRTPQHEVEARRLADAWIAALNSQDLVKVRGLLTPDASYHDVPYDQTYSGAELDLFWRRVWSQFPNAPVSLVSVTADKDRMAIEWRAVVARADHAPITVSDVSVLELEGYRIKQVTTYYDTSVFLQLLHPSRNG